MLLPLRLAGRQLRQGPVGFLLGAVFLALPLAGLIATNTLILNSENCTGSWFDCRDPASGTTFAVGTVMLPLIFAIMVMIGANLIVATRRNERMLALLRATGATSGTLFWLVSAAGLLQGVAAAILASVLGVGVAWSWMWRVAPIDPVAVLGLSALCVLLGWATSVVAAAVAINVDSNRVLRGIPRLPGPSWRSDRVGAVVALVGLVMLATGALVLSLLWRFGNDPQEPPLLLTAIGGLGASALTGFGPIVMITGLLFMLPRLFRMLGSAFRPFGLPARLAARDAERHWTRSVPAGAAVLVTSFAIGGYMSMAALSNGTSTQQYLWELQEGQFAVSLTVPSVSGGELGLIPVDNYQGVADEARDRGISDDARALDGVQGPFYGQPVPDNEGYSGRVEILFPSEGLPHPRLAEPNICVVEPVAAWRCADRPYYDPFGFPLDAYTPTIWVGDEADLRLILGGDVGPATSAALERGDALVFDARYLAADGMVTIDWHGEDFVPENEPGEFLPAGDPLRSETLDGHLVPLDHAIDFGVFLSESAAAGLGLEAHPRRVLGTIDMPVDKDNNGVVYAALADLVGPNAGAIVEMGPSEPERGWTEGALILGAGVSLAVALVAVGLARHEGRGADRTIAALGGSPGIRRRISGWYALILIGTTSVLGTAAGMLWAVASTISYGLTLGAMPWVPLAALAFGVPLLAAGAARLAPGFRMEARTDRP